MATTFAGTEIERLKFRSGSQTRIATERSYHYSATCSAGASRTTTRGVFHVRKTRDLVEVIVPFMDEHLPPSHKRTQYEAWRAALLEHWEHTVRRRRACTVEGCDRPQTFGYG